MGVSVLLGPLSSESPALELAFAHALVRRAGRGELDEVVRIYRPSLPMVVFGRRDVRLPGLQDAVLACKDAGFATAVRATGGRAVAFTGQAVVVDHVKWQHNAAEDQERRFVSIGSTLADILTGLGVDARLGSVPGEYCPGSHSVNARGVVKLIGTAQRVTRDAWLFSSLVVVDDTAILRPILGSVYRSLDLPFDAASVGGVTEEAPSATVAGVEQAIVTRFAPSVEPIVSEADRVTLDLAYELLPQHTLV